jgi:integrase
MPSAKDQRTGKWFWRKQVRLENGKPKRLFGGPFDKKSEADDAEREALEKLKKQKGGRGPIPTLDEWVYGTANPNDPKAEPNGRYWEEWVISRKNKPSTVEAKKEIYRLHIHPELGSCRLDQIKSASVARLRAKLVRAGKKEKTINNVLGVLSTPLVYAAEDGLIERAPRIGMFKIERPEIEFYSFEEYARILASAKQEGEIWYAGTCLAGEEGFRVGEVKAVRWREGIDLIAETVTVREQVRRKQFGTPKGRTRRTIPMTTTTLSALKGMAVVREGIALKNRSGHAISDTAAKAHMYRICRRAGLPERGWHILRHTFATHAAMLGVNPWSLNQWMGHKSMEETMGYVHLAQNHRREIPAVVMQAGQGVMDPDQRVMAQLGARVLVDFRGSEMAAEPGTLKIRQKLQAVD